MSPANRKRPRRDPAGVRAYGERIRAAREAENLTQRELSDKIGVAPPFISQIEQGKRLPSDETCSSLASVLPTLTAAELVLEAHKLRSPAAARALDESASRAATPTWYPRFQELVRRVENSGLPREAIERLVAAWLQTLEVAER